MRENLMAGTGSKCAQIISSESKDKINKENDHEGLYSGTHR